MKKIICILSGLLMICASSFAQETAKQPPMIKAGTAVKASHSKSESPSVKAAAKTANVNAAAKMKKDGTPDMRAKENKAGMNANTARLKKDGTPDMRYKANKAALNKSAVKATPAK